VGSPVTSPVGDREAALDWAAAARRRRGELRHELSSGSRTLDDVLSSVEETGDGATRLLFVLESLPRAGKVATRRHLSRLGLSETLALADLSADQQVLVLAEFPVPAETS